MQKVDRMISGGTILVMDDKDHTIRNGAVAIKGETIVAVGGKEEIESRYISREIINAEGFLVMPGLINCHTHAPMTYFRGLADDLELTDWLNNYIFPDEARFVNGEFSYLRSGRAHV